jgi:hemolysin III
VNGEAIHAREERANVITHAAGALAATAGAALLVVLAALGGDPWRIVSSALFGCTLVLLYTASTLYHASRRPRVRARLKVLDHCAIYLLIAGTYTPFTLIGLRGGWGWSLFGAIWGLAAAGAVFKLFFTGRFPRLSTTLYLAMGWLVVVAAVPMLQRIPAVTLLWLLAGGLSYSAGTLFYHSRRIPYAHAIWHLFVLGGSICHFVAVVREVLPPVG